MKNKTNDIIIIIVFLIIISIPQLLFFLINNYISLNNRESETLEAKPEFSFKNIDSYFNDFSKYYDENLPFRQYIRKLYANMRFYLFRESLNDVVLIGKNDGEKSLTWLFYKNDNDGKNPVREAQGILTYSEQEKLNILNNIIENTEKLKEKNIELYYVIIPNKENVYKEKLPDNINIVNNYNRTEELVGYLKEKNINIIYPIEELKNGKNIVQTYWRQDTHWNDYGAFIGLKKIMNEIEPTYNEFDIKLNISDPEIIYKDLVNLSEIKDIFRDNKINVEYKNQIDFYIEERTMKDILRFTYCGEAKYDKTVIILGDSFRETFVKYFSKIYKKVVYVHISDYKKEMIEKYKPDIVIFETVERYSGNLESFKIY